MDVKTVNQVRELIWATASQGKKKKCWALALSTPCSKSVHTLTNRQAGTRTREGGSCASFYGIVGLKCSKNYWVYASTWVHMHTYIHNMCIHPSQHQSFHSASWSFSTRTSVFVLGMYTGILTGVTKKGKCEDSLREIEFHITIRRTGCIVYIIHFFPQTSFPSFSGTATELPTFHPWMLFNPEKSTS